MAICICTHRMKRCMQKTLHPHINTQLPTTYLVSPHPYKHPPPYVCIYIQPFPPGPPVMTKHVQKSRSPSLSFFLSFYPAILLGVLSLAGYWFCIYVVIGLRFYFLFVLFSFIFLRVCTILRLRPVLMLGDGFNCGWRWGRVGVFMDG